MNGNETFEVIAKGSFVVDVDQNDGGATDTEEPRREPENNFNQTNNGIEIDLTKDHLLESQSWEEIIQLNSAPTRKILQTKKLHADSERRRRRINRLFSSIQKSVEPTKYKNASEVSQDEYKFYTEAYRDVSTIRFRRIQCTSCRKHIGTTPADESLIKMHPILRVTQCEKCYDFYNSGEFDKGSDGSEYHCRWCGQGGKVFCCTTCPFVFCQPCISKNLGLATAVSIFNNKKWTCLSCSPLILWRLRAQHWALMSYIHIQKGNLDMTRCCKQYQKADKQFTSHSTNHGCEETSSETSRENIRFNSYSPQNQVMSKISSTNGNSLTSTATPNLQSQNQLDSDYTNAFPIPMNNGAQIRESNHQMRVNDQKNNAVNSLPPPPGIHPFNCTNSSSTASTSRNNVPILIETSLPNATNANQLNFNLTTSPMSTNPHTTTVQFFQYQAEIVKAMEHCCSLVSRIQTIRNSIINNVASNQLKQELYTPLSHLLTYANESFKDLQIKCSNDMRELNSNSSPSGGDQISTTTALPATLDSFIMAGLLEIEFHENEHQKSMNSLPSTDVNAKNQMQGQKKGKSRINEKQTQWNKTSAIGEGGANCEHLKHLIENDKKLKMACKVKLRRLSSERKEFHCGALTTSKGKSQKSTKFTPITPFNNEIKLNAVKAKKLHQDPKLEMHPFISLSKVDCSMSSPSASLSSLSQSKAIDINQINIKEEVDEANKIKQQKSQKNKKQTQSNKKIAMGGGGGNYEHLKHFIENDKKLKRSSKVKLRRLSSERKEFHCGALTISKGKSQKNTKFTPIPQFNNQLKLNAAKAKKLHQDPKLEMDPFISLPKVDCSLSSPSASSSSLSQSKAIDINQIQIKEEVDEANEIEQQNSNRTSDDENVNCSFLRSGKRKIAAMNGDRKRKRK